MSDKIAEIMKKVIESKKEKSAQQGTILRPDMNNAATNKASTRRKKSK